LLALASPGFGHTMVGMKFAAESPPGADKSVTLFLCGDGMTGRGIDQVLPHPRELDRMSPDQGGAHRSRERRFNRQPAVADRGHHDRYTRAGEGWHGAVPGDLIELKTTSKVTR
jgi:hypothetical protein